MLLTISLGCAAAGDSIRPTLSVRTFGCEPDGRDCAAPLAAAMAACAQRGGCTLTFPPLPSPGGGQAETVYRSSSWALAASNVTLVVPPGVTVRATETDAANMAPGAAWPTLPWLEHPSMPCNDCPYACGAGCGPAKRAWLHAQNVSGVVIEGGGTFHGGGQYWWCARDPQQVGHKHAGQMPAYCAPRNSTNTLRSTCPPRMVHFVGASDVVMRNVTFKYSGFWMMHLQFCDGVLLDGVTLYNPDNATYEAANGDGLDVGSSRNIVVRNSVLDMSDDQICVRAGQGHAAATQAAASDGVGEGRCGLHSMLVEDCEIRNGHGISFGSDGVGGVRNVTFRNIYMNGNGPQGHHVGAGYHGTARVAVIFVKANHGGEWRDLTWRNIHGVNVVGGISLTEDHSNAHGDPPWPLPLPLPLGAGPAPSGPPRFENILFEDFNLTVGGYSSANFATVPGTIKNLTLRRVHLRPTAAQLARQGSISWVCKTVDCHGGKGQSCDPPTAPAGPIEENRFFCDGCTAEDVRPAMNGDRTSSSGKTKESYDCRFVL